MKNILGKLIVIFIPVVQYNNSTTLSSNTINNINKNIYSQEKNYNAYYNKFQNEKNTIPNLKGMSGMDAITLLENKGLHVKIKGVGKVKSQSIGIGGAHSKNSSIVLELR